MVKRKVTEKKKRKVKGRKKGDRKGDKVAKELATGNKDLQYLQKDFFFIFLKSNGSTKLLILLI